MHFTPEYVSGQQWRAQAEGDHGFVELPFMSSDQEEIERELVMLCSVHLLILSLLDECLDRALSGHQEWNRERHEVAARAQRLRATTEGEVT